MIFIRVFSQTTQIVLACYETGLLVANLARRGRQINRKNLNYITLNQVNNKSFTISGLFKGTPHSGKVMWRERTAVLVRDTCIPYFFCKLLYKGI